jgi:hypothetical protein
MIIVCRKAARLIPSLGVFLFVGVNKFLALNLEMGTLYSPLTVLYTFYRSNKTISSFLFTFFAIIARDDRENLSRATDRKHISVYALSVARDSVGFVRILAHLSHGRKENWFFTWIGADNVHWSKYYRADARDMLGG